MISGSQSMWRVKSTDGVSATMASSTGRAKRKLTSSDSTTPIGRTSRGK